MPRRAAISSAISALVLIVACAKGVGTGGSSSSSNDDDGAGGSGGATSGGGQPASGGGGSGGDGTGGAGGCNATFVNTVTDALTPSQPGSGVAGVWSYMGNLGEVGGTAMCVAIGADHVCTLPELMALSQSGGLTVVPTGTQLWVPGQLEDCDGWTNASFGINGVYAPVNSGMLGVTAPGACNGPRAIPCCSCP